MLGSLRVADSFKLNTVMVWLLYRAAYVAIRSFMGINILIEHSTSYKALTVVGKKISMCAVLPIIMRCC